MSKNTLEQLLGSKVRVKVLRFLFRNENAVFDARGLSKRIQESTGATTEEIRALTAIRLLRRKKK